MKRFLLIFSILMLLLSQLVAGNKQLKNFEKLMQALKGGEAVSVVLHYGDCQLEYEGETQEESVDAIGGMEIDVFEYFAAGSIRNELAFVVSSKSKLIQNPLGEGYVYNYVKLKVDETGRVTVTARYIDPLTFETLMDEKFHGQLNNGKNDACVYFYKLK